VTLTAASTDHIHQKKDDVYWAVTIESQTDETLKEANNFWAKLVHVCEVIIIVQTVLGQTNHQ